MKEIKAERTLYARCQFLYIFTDQHNVLCISFQDHSQTSSKLAMDGIINSLSGLFKPKWEVGRTLDYNQGTMITHKTMTDRVQVLIIKCLASHCTLQTTSMLQ